MDEETRRIHRLLSDGKLSGPEAEEILANVLAAVAREKPRPVRAIRYLVGAGTVLAAAAVVLLIVYGPSDPADVRIPEEGDVPGLRVRCEPGELAACPASSKLVFEVPGKGVSGSLSAYAEPVGHDAERVFYFSKEDGSAELPPDGAGHPIGLAKPGRYRIHAMIADRPLTRAELLGPAPADGAKIRVEVRVEIVVSE